MERIDISLFAYMEDEMSLLLNTEPKRVFHYFEEIAAIPHASYNTKPIANYLVDFAKAHDLRYHRDEYDNVIIFKKAFSGYEASQPIIIQGHSDMVAEKEVDCVHDFDIDGLKLLIDGDYLKAAGTTLGGDDGIALAIALAILEDDTLKHPALEAVFTANEEVGLLGASQLDASVLTGTRLINLDSEEEGFLLAGCAGGLTAQSTFTMRYQEMQSPGFEVVIDGLKGGHSGMEIDKNRANANILMGRFLHRLDGQIEYSLAEINGGQKDNVITRNNQVLILTEAHNEAVLTSVSASLEEELRKEYHGSDDLITVRVNKLGTESRPVLHPVDKEKLIFFLMNSPFGVIKMSNDIAGLVETSINLGRISSTPQGVDICFGIRSSIGSAKAALTEQVKYLTEFLGGEFTVNGEYPAWEYQDNSPLREIMQKTYQTMFGQEIKVTAIHAGLECGIFYDKISGLDCVSLGPDVFDVHSPNERLSISSVARTYQYLLQVLADSK